MIFFSFGFRAVRGPRRVPVREWNTGGRCGEQWSRYDAGKPVAQDEQQRSDESSRTSESSSRTSHQTRKIAIAERVLFAGHP